MYPENSPLLAALSEHLLRNAGAAVWRKVFLRSGNPAIRFERRVLTLLYANALGPGWGVSEVEFLAQRFEGWGELCSGDDVLLSFEHPLQALRAALLLQKLGADTGVGAGLTTGLCTIAHFELDGEACRMVLPPEATRPEASARRAPPGTVVIGAETYELLAHCLVDEVRDGLIATECEADRVTQVSITLAPHSGADLSTFAGLGMS